MLDYQKICDQVCSLSKEVGAYQRNENQKLKQDDIQFKKKNDLVSYVDLESEKRIIECLKTIIPESRFLAEESHSDCQEIGEEPIWIIDPLDGTTNYIHQVPVYSVSIALYVHKKPVVGVVYEAGRDECFYSWENAPAYLNGKPVKAKTTTELQQALIGTGFPIKDFSVRDVFLKIISELVIRTRGIRRLGSAAVDLAYVACGRYDAFFEFNLNPWDVAAGQFIASQAGARISDFKGGDNYLFGQQILASGAFLYEDVLKIIQENVDV
jgi:myo-inositol-1(or 4)-monophosphatase